jgi:hypothetical protein
MAPPITTPTSTLTSENGPTMVSSNFLRDFARTQGNSLPPTRTVLSSAQPQIRCGGLTELPDFDWETDRRALAEFR